MGLTGGIVDVDGLLQCLQGIHQGMANDTILSTWSDVQRQKWHEIINPVSSGNIKRLFGQDPEKALEEDSFLKMVKKAESDPTLSKDMQHSGNKLLHDYSQYFRQVNGHT